jgi:hypothetical protein
MLTLESSPPTAPLLSFRGKWISPITLNTYNYDLRRIQTDPWSEIYFIFTL